MNVATMTKVPASDTAEQTRSVTDMAKSCRGAGAMVYHLETVLVAQESFRFIDLAKLSPPRVK